MSSGLMDTEKGGEQTQSVRPQTHSHVQITLTSLTFTDTNQSKHSQNHTKSPAVN